MGEINMNQHTNMMGATSGAETDYSSGVPEFTPGF